MIIRPPISIVYAWRNVLARKASTLVTTLGIAVSVTVFIVIRATADGVSRVAVSSGSPRNVLVLAAGATSAELSYLDTSTINRVRFVPIEIVESTAAGGMLITGLPEEARIITVGQGFVAEGQLVTPVEETSELTQAGNERAY